MHRLVDLDRIRLLFRKERESYLRLYAILGFYPKSLRFYKEAFLHKSSMVRGKTGRLVNNERLEFLGDAILDAIVADIVFSRFTGKREGFLTNARSKIVQRETLNQVAMAIGLDKLMTYSPSSSSHNSYMCGNAFEALVGAIYLDRGYDYCMRFMEERILGQHINLDKTAYKEVNFKSRLIEWGQRNRMQVDFVLVEQLQEQSSPVFQSEARVEGLLAGEGSGYSKKESQQLAAKEALLKLRKGTLLQEAQEAKERRLAAAADVPLEELPPVQQDDTEPNEGEC